jgi:hypothetical protein
MRITLYRPQGNNGIQLLMTQDAWDAHRELDAYRNEHGDDVQDSTVRGLQLRIGYGTFTFASAAALVQIPRGANCHYGTYEVLDYIVGLCNVYRVEASVSVPFSNGPYGYTADFQSGYGVKPGLFQDFLATALAAYENTDDIQNILENAGK